MIATDTAKAQLARYFKLHLKDCRGDYDITITSNETRQILRYHVHEDRFRLLPEEVCPEVKTLRADGSVAWWLVRFLFKHVMVTDKQTAMVSFETAAHKVLVHITPDGRYRRAGHL